MIIDIVLPVAVRHQRQARADRPSQQRGAILGRIPKSICAYVKIACPHPARFNRWFAAWRDDGRFERMNHALVMADRKRAGRDASPSAAIIDRRSVKTTEAGGPRGYDAGKKVNRHKRHALVGGPERIDIYPKTIRSTPQPWG